MCVCVADDDVGDVACVCVADDAGDVVCVYVCS